MRTISNAFETGRIPQAWILTGVRGVGKTTTARILARALNYELPDGSVTGPTIAMPKLGLHCQAIMESRHIDVIEMDAASHNGVDDVRQINDAIRYAPVSARYKVYILDEVHMLSTQAFNALLKTLEEPPPHAKFIFATTEIRKVPVTVLSRCQRFDLRRVDAAMLVDASRRHRRQGEHRRRAGGAGADRARRRRLGARRAVAARPGDRACAPGDDRARRTCATCWVSPTAPASSTCSKSLMKGDVAAALEGAARAVRHRRRSVGGAGRPRRVHPFRHPREDRAGGGRRHLAGRGRAHARPRARRRAVDARAVAHLADAAQGHRARCRRAGRPLAAAEMVLVRIAYVADLPTPDEAIRSLDDGGGAVRARRPAARQRRRCERRSGSSCGWRGARVAPRFDAPRGGGPRAMARQPRSRRDRPQLPQSAPALVINTFEELVALAERQARHADQARAGARRAAGSLRGRQARNRARAGRGQDAGQRSVAQACSNGPAGAGWW